MTDETPGQSGSRARRAGDRKLTPRGGPAAAMWYVLALFLLVALGQAFYFSIQAGEPISYSEFKQGLREGRVQEVFVAEDRIRETMKGGPKGTHPFTAVRIEDPKLIEDLEKAGVKASGETANKWVAEVIGWIIPFVFLVALWRFFFRRLGSAEGGVMSAQRRHHHGRDEPAGSARSGPAPPGTFRSSGARG